MKNIKTIIKNILCEMDNSYNVEADGFKATNKGLMKGYEVDNELQGGFYEIDVHLNRPLDLGNNYNEHHFIDALTTTYDYDSDLADYINTLNLNDTVTFYFKGNYGNHREVWGMSDLSDFLGDKW